jgi:hypothetical protein
MVMAKAKLKLVDAGRTPEREALAKAIAALTKVERDQKRRHDAVERARELVAGAKDKLAEAREAVEVAKSNAANRAIRATKKSGASVDGAGTRKARLLEADAQDALDAAQTALERCEANISPYESLIGDRERRAVDEAVWAVIRVSSAPARVLAEAVAATEEALRARAALYQLHETRDPYDRDAPGPLGDIKADALSLLHRGSEFIDEHFASRHPGATMWKDAIEALCQDPDALLPE